MSQTDILLESGTNELEIVEFYIDEQLPDGEVYRGHYGINVAKVLEIIRQPGITQLPTQTKTAVMGTFNLRDRVIPLIDLARSLGKKAAPVDEPKVVVTRFNEVINAFLVSGVTRIYRLSWEQVEAPKQHMLDMTDDSITGVVRIDDRVVFLLDMEKIVGDLNPRFALSVTDDEIDHDDDFVYKTLIVDDSPTIRRMIQASLLKMGFEVTPAINGKDAWDKLEAMMAGIQESGDPLNDHLHVIISDIEMPVMDGHSLTKRIKDTPGLKDVPVLLFSSLITESLRHKGEAVGADDQISKPDMKTLGDRSKSLANTYLGRA
ncbi:chemotaxis protein [Desulfovibrio ferrophilus]|uniref:Response regulator receiver modulated CheW protein n=1 Tax=Desulfovibrio ferrophilus TaxID=241368 RepID=A0A2Z6AXN6_9BACT|nr:chemotaxis protein [Desulfovibrio ferrophilus]BBD08001.1 response regulator receiver modulated CheW protein [Desulfovibrio ferrophilus]